MISESVLSCTVPASRSLTNVAQTDDIKDVSLVRSIRQVGMQCLVEIFASVQRTDLSREANTVLNDLIAPRLNRFASENAQSVSGMLRLFGAWSNSRATSQYMSGCDDSILEHLAGLLQEPTAKDEVRLFVLQDILGNLLQDGSGQAIMQPHVSHFAASFGQVLEHQPSKDVLDACVKTLAGLAELISDPEAASAVISVCSSLLTKPAVVVSSSTKSGLLRTLLSLLDQVDGVSDVRLYEAICGLFSRLQHHEARVLCSETLLKLSRLDHALIETAEICGNLNAISGRLDEIDHERRDLGFTRIIERGRSFTSQQWLPIVQNCLYYLRDAEDQVNRLSASQALQHFLESVTADDAGSLGIVSKNILPAIERGMQETSELVRSEYLRLLGVLVDTMPELPAVKDLKSLSVGGDDEASVFSNILHIQQHRRLRALRRLADEAVQVSSNNALKIFLPLLEHFVFDPAEGDAGRTLADQTVSTIGSIAAAMNWTAFKATFKRYVGYISSKEDLEKTVLRLLGALVDALGPGKIAMDDQKAQVVSQVFLPPLMDYLHQKDESTVDRRMPVAVTVVKLLKVLPAAEMSEKLAPVLTDVCHVLRSRSAPARDQTRKTLTSILSLVGTTYLGFIVKELRSALQRGYQLHVLSYTVHSLLVSVMDVSIPGDFDHCLSDLVSIIMDDIFGITGQEKDAEEYKSGMKEVKSSKSYDTMELLARVTPIVKLGQLLQPLRALLTQKLDAKMIAKADNLLTRLRKGLDQKQAADSREVLIFCHETVRQVHAAMNAGPSNGRIQDARLRRYLVQREAPSKSLAKGATSSQLFKLQSFAFNLVRKVLRRHEELQTSANMAGFLPMLGDALVQGQEEVKVAAMRLLATIMRLPILELDANALVYVKEAIAVVKGATSTNTEASKAALELVTAVLREKRSVVVKETDLATAVKTIRSDIDEPDRQGITYKFLRALLSRKIEITEVYEVMDEVGKVMVTNPDRNIRESARGAFLQFLVDYPQGKKRWSKQADVLVANLEYEHAGGRQSVLELLHQLLSKVGDDVVKQLGRKLFVSLVLVQVNDEDTACRQMAGLLTGRLLERADTEQTKTFATYMDTWLRSKDKPEVQIASLRCWAFYLRTKAVPSTQVDGLRQWIVKCFNDEEFEVGPHLLKAILETFSVVVDVAPENAFAANAASIWSTWLECLALSDAEIQEAAARLVSAYFSHLASSSSKLGSALAVVPLKGSGGLQLDEEGMRKACRLGVRGVMTISKETNETLISQLVAIMAFVGRCFAANELHWLRQNEDTEAIEAVELDEEDSAAVTQDPSALAYLLNRLSYIIRQETLSTKSRSAALQCQTAIINKLDNVPNLQSVLRPLYTLTDPAIPQPSTDAHRDLVDKARELLDLMQKKVGSETYVAALGQARKLAKEKRDDRRQKRRIEAVSAPERWAMEKKRKHEASREKKKVKGFEARGRRRGW